MMKWKATLRNIMINTILVVGSLFFMLLLLEMIFRVLPVATSPSLQMPTSDNPIQRYRPYSSFTWSQDWNLQNVVHGRSNAQGFIADYDYDASVTSPLLAVIGDSFIEALTVRFPETVTGRLQKDYGANARVYSFAQSGSPLSQYIAYAKYACATYHPQRMVINIVGNDFDESIYANRVRNGIFHLHATPDGFESVLTPESQTGFLESTARQSAFVTYLLRNASLRNAIQQLLDILHISTTTRSYVGNSDADASVERVTEAEHVLEWFLSQLSNSMCIPPGHIVIVVDAMRPQIYDAAQLSDAQTSYFGLMRSKIIADASAGGFTVVDLEQPFLAAYAQDHQPFEFSNDSHWNARGHAVVAAEIKAALAGWPLQQATQ